MLINILNSAMITNVILALLPFIATLAYYFCRLIEQRLPKNQANMLDRVVMHAVQMVEQCYPDAGGTAKKKLAENIISDLIKSLGLPAPSIAAIDTALEASVFQLQQMPSILSAKQANAVMVVGQVQGVQGVQGADQVHGTSQLGSQVPRANQGQGVGQALQTSHTAGTAATEMALQPNFAYTPSPMMAGTGDATSTTLHSWPGNMGTPAPNMSTPGNIYTGNTVNPSNNWGAGNL